MRCVPGCGRVRVPDEDAVVTSAAGRTPSSAATTRGRASAENPSPSEITAIDVAEDARGARDDASANAQKTRTGERGNSEYRRASYFGRESHHKAYRAVRGVGTITKSVRVPPNPTPGELRRDPPPRPAEALHAGYFELDGGLPAYVAGMRARDEALLPVDRRERA